MGGLGILNVKKPPKAPRWVGWKLPQAWRFKTGIRVRRGQLSIPTGVGSVSTKIQAVIEQPKLQLNCRFQGWLPPPAISQQSIIQQ
jgi:hypothetical protein